jgi:site-specific recombinase XerD
MRHPARRPSGRWESRVREYLDHRRTLGFRLRSIGDELVLFGRYLDLTRYRGPLTADVIARWACLAPNARPEYAAWRLGAVRVFVKYLAATDLRHQVPPARLLGRTYRRAQPHIYSPAEIAALLDACTTVKPVKALPPHTYRAFFGLLAATGLRCGEALGLRGQDVDLSLGRLTILRGKPGRTRVVPLHESVVRELSNYAERRDGEFRAPKSDAFFLSRRATALRYQSVAITFRQLRRQLGWHDSPLPRVHDLRHTFAVRTLVRWCEAGHDVDTKILALTTYLGHVNVTSTYWYFSAVPELMAMTGRRFAAYAGRDGGE